MKKTKNFLTEKLINVGEKICDTTEKTVKHTAKFLEREIPEVTKEVILWGVIDTGVWFVVGTIITLISGLKLSLRGLFGGDIGINIVYLVCVIIAVSIMFTSTEWIKPLVTPRLYLLEWLRKKLKK